MSLSLTRVPFSALAVLSRMLLFSSLELWTGNRVRPLSTAARKWASLLPVSASLCFRLNFLTLRLDMQLTTAARISGTLAMPSSMLLWMWMTAAPYPLSSPVVSTEYIPYDNLLDHPVPIHAIILRKNIAGSGSLAISGNEFLCHPFSFIVCVLNRGRFHEIS